MNRLRKIVKSDIFRLFLSLLLISATVALLLAGVNMLTKDKIAAHDGEAELQIVRQFYNYDSVFVREKLEDGTEYFSAHKPVYPETPAALSEASASLSASLAESSAASASSSASSAESSAASASSTASSAASSEESSAAPLPEPEPGELIGYAVTVSENGYGGEIKLLVAFDVYGRVSGLGVVSMSETSGVGTRITGEGFFDRFVGKIAPFKFVKGSASSKNDIVGINGASVSSKAIVGAVNKAYVLLSDLFETE